MVSIQTATAAPGKISGRLLGREYQNNHLGLAATMGISS